MKRTIWGILFVWLFSGDVISACIVSKVVNNSLNTSLVFTEGTIVLKESEQPHIVPPRKTIDDDPVVALDVQINVGEYLIIQANEEDSGGIICKEYILHQKKKTITLKQKDSCMRRGSYHHKVAKTRICPQECYVELIFEKSHLTFNVLNSSACDVSK